MKNNGNRGGKAAGGAGRKGTGTGSTGSTGGKVSQGPARTGKANTGKAAGGGKAGQAGGQRQATAKLPPWMPEPPPQAAGRAPKAAPKAAPKGPPPRGSAPVRPHFQDPYAAREAGRVGATEVNLTRAVLVLPLFALAALVTVGPQAVGDLRWSNLGWLSLSMLCSYGLGDLIFYLTALRLGTPTGLSISSIFPVWSALLGALTLGEKISGGRAAGIACCIGGVCWLVRLQAPEDAPKKTLRGRELATGVALALLTSLLWAGNAYSIRRGAVGLPMFLVNTFRYFMAVPVLFPRMGRWFMAMSVEPGDAVQLLFNSSAIGLWRRSTRIDNVEGIVRASLNRGYEMFVVEDGCAGVPQEWHDWSIAKTARCVFTESCTLAWLSRFSRMQSMK